MNKQKFIDEYMELFAGSYQFDMKKGFRVDKEILEDMDEGRFKEVIFFELRKLRQQFVQEMDRITKKIVKGGFG